MPTCQFAFGAMTGDRVQAMNTSGLVSESETVAGTNAATTAAADASQNVCRVATDTACYVSFGTAPDAGTDADRVMMPANSVDYFKIRVGDKGACIAV